MTVCFHTPDDDGCFDLGIDLREEDDRGPRDLVQVLSGEDEIRVYDSDGRLFGVIDTRARADRA